MNGQIDDLNDPEFASLPRRPIECVKCGRVFDVPEGDIPSNFRSIDGMFLKSATFSCPECKKLVSVFVGWGIEASDGKLTYPDEGGE